MTYEEIIKNQQYEPTERHHIIFRSSGGIEHRLNLIDLAWSFHKGDQGPHRNRLADLALKRHEQKQLFELFKNENYEYETIIELVDPFNKKSTEKLKKQLINTPNTLGFYKREDIVRTLMGGKLY